LVLIFKIGIPVIILGFFSLSKYKVFSTASLFDRFRLWGSEINIDYNVVFGGAIGNVGGGARGGGFIETIDSYWLFLLLSVGIVGIVISLLFIYEKSKKTNKYLFILISFFFAGFLVNLTQSIVFLVLFPMLFIRVKEDFIKIETNGDNEKT